MILDNGITTLTVSDSYSNPDVEVDSERKVTVGGRIKIQSGGERFKAVEECVLTAAQYRALVNMLKSDYNTMYYTPTVVPPEYTANDFPMTVHVDKLSKTRRAYDGANVVYYCTFELTSTEYL